MKNRLELIGAVADRAQGMGLCRSDRLSFVMDMDCAHKHFKVRWEDLLKADRFDFAHDVLGIQNHVNRATEQFENCFVPRYAGK